MAKILIVEDEVDIREELTLLLENEGYRVEALTHFESVDDQVFSCGPDLILLDLGLPGRDGFLLCRSIRKKTKTHIIFVTSRDNSLDEIKGLSLGGDDYVTKPYNVPVLLALIRAVLRRGGEAADRLEANGLALNLVKGELVYMDKSCTVTKNELRILSYLMRRPGQIVSRPQLIDALWENGIFIDDNALSVNMTRLRAKLASLGLEDYVMTRRGLGYTI